MSSSATLDLAAEDLFQALTRYDISEEYREKQMECAKLLLGYTDIFTMHGFDLERHSECLAFLDINILIVSSLQMSSVMLPSSFEARADLRVGTGISERRALCPRKTRRPLRGTQTWLAGLGQMSGK